MTDVLLKPAFVSLFADSGDVTKFGPAAWNAARLFSAGTVGDLVVRNTTSTTGASWRNPGWIDVRDYGAVGNGVTDDSAAIQAAITAAAALSAAVYFPGGVYVIASTITIATAVTLRGGGGMGPAQPVLLYTGIGTAMAIGNGTDVCYAVTLENLGLRVPNGATAAVAISLKRVSGAIFNYVTINGGATSGKFTVGWRFEDSGLINMLRPIVSNQLGVTGSIAFQFVNSVNLAHNSHIGIVGADVYAMDTVFDLRDVQHLTVRDAWCETNGTIVLFDQAQCTSTDATPDLQVSDLLLDGNTFLLNGAAVYPNQRVLVGIGAAAKTLELDLITLTSNRIFCTTSVTYPLKFDMAAGTFNSLRLPTVLFDGNYVYAVDTALAYADTANLTIVMGANYLRTSALAVPTVGAGLIVVTARALLNAANVFTLAQSVTKDALAAVSTDALILQNTTAATAGAPVQQSPRLRLRSNVWNSTTPANNTDDWFIESVPANGAAPSGLLKFGKSLNGGAATYPLTLDSFGQLSSLANVILTQFAGLQITNAGQLGGNAVTGQFLLRNVAVNAGVGLDVATDATLKIRTRAHTGDANLAAASVRGNAVTFANVPATPVEGMLVAVTDSTTAVWGATITGTGANHVLAYYNGTNWTVAGK